MSPTTRERTQATEAASERVLAHLVTHLPSLGVGQALELPTAARAHRFTGLRQLDAHLQAHPDALTSGASDCPRALVRLLHRLVEAGHPVQLARCHGCGQTDKPLLHKRIGGRICDTCQVRDATWHEVCTHCGQRRRPGRRLPDGSAVCSSCQVRPAATCVRCGRLAPPAANRPAGPTCSRCYDTLERPHRRCGGCGQVRLIKKRGRHGQPDLCGRCHQPTAVCSRCRQERACLRITTGAPVCQACRDLPTPPCCRCGRARPVAARWPMGGVCQHCYHHLRSHPRPCPIARASDP